MQYPTKFYISSGAGESQYKLVAFDNALIAAGISNYNLLKVSSILPSFCEQCDKVDAKEGSPLLTAFATIASDKKGMRLASAIAVGIPKDKSNIGVIMEYGDEQISANEAEHQAINMIRESMKNHRIEVEKILSSSIEGTVQEGYLSLVSAIVLW